MIGIILNGLLVTSVVFASAESFAAAKPKAKRLLASNGDPYEGEYRNSKGHVDAAEMFAKAPSPYVNLLDQNDLDMVGAKLLRANKPQFGIGFANLNKNASTKFDAGKNKHTITSSPVELYGVYPTPIGLRVGFDYLQADLKQKVSLYPSTDASLKLTSERMAITVAGALTNGFGGALILSNNKESVSGSIGSISLKDQDVTWGEIAPELFYATDNFETIFKWTQSLRHETRDRTGKYELSAEYGTSEIHPLFNLTRYRASEDDDDSEYDYFSVGGGIRYILDRESNIRVLIGAREASYTERQNSTPFNNAGFGVLVAGEHVLQAMHVLGYGVQYLQYSGKGKSGNTSTTIAADTTAFALSYKFVMR